MCRHASHLRVIHGTSVAAEYCGKVNLGAVISAQVCVNRRDYTLSAVICAQVYVNRGSYTLLSAVICAQLLSAQVCVNRLLSEWGGGSAPVFTVKDDHIHEMCRYGAAQIHSVASYVGGCAAHEIIKLITAQYVPLNNTLIYNAATATSLTLTL
ncbi:hypothetical protein HAZT_HAZT011643 [Hyalella azteca]|uniref:THIF-type NAD/FAD binding fold domain-containing protein n=1 Tax=Hyalella azteca TaxID=294128 RepID=A0A6A0GWH4_HYAAZ|nr:hypothetical protein HAZT_HAZT011643 [Hyalella azteca]